MWIAGVEGCRGGWAVVLVSTDAVEREHRVTVCANFREVLELQPSPDVIVVDIPIGLLDDRTPGGRECDKEARKLLGPRRNSVFTPPHRSILNAHTYEDVRTKGLSQQAFGILPKVRDVDEVITPGLQNRIHESHPELAFLHMASRPMSVYKRN